MIKWLSNNIPNESYSSLFTMIINMIMFILRIILGKKFINLDWEMCTLGDSLMDLGTSLAYWTMDNDHPE